MKALLVVLCILNVTSVFAASNSDKARNEARMAASEEFRASLQTGKKCVEDADADYQKAHPGRDMSEDEYAQLITTCLAPEETE